MVIGIIGAGLAGLTAGRLLAKAGHEVTILEKSRGFGGRMSTRYAGKNLEIKLDHGITHFSATSPEFQEFTAELLEKNLIRLWGKNFPLYNGESVLDADPNPNTKAVFTATQGMNSIGKYLSRWVDVKNEAKVGGLTFIGNNTTKKRPWMINLSSRDTFEADAVIIATPAPQAYGIIQTTVDETNTLKIIREIDEVHYRPAYSLMVGYEKEDIPEWNGIKCQGRVIEFISNEASKREGNQPCSFVVQSNESFARNHRHSDENIVMKKMIDELSEIVGGWASTPDWQQIHFWKFSRPKKVLNVPYMELEFQEAPLALVGDYFEDNTLDGAYRSGYKLAKSWIANYKS
jgi:predicted NAD/FAD-dependent oxidoreductase